MFSENWFAAKTGFGDLRTVQGRERDITMFPAFTVGDLSWRILAHPRACDMEHFLLGGRRMVRLATARADFGYSAHT